MSINAINSISVYEYYYTINPNNKRQKIATLKQDERTPRVEDEKEPSQIPKTNEEEKDIPPEKRPWADLMYQLGLSFNKDPKDDIDAIKSQLRALLLGVSDEELEQEVQDLTSYVERLYLSFAQGGVISGTYVLQNELDKISDLNKFELISEVKNQQQDTRE